MKLRIRGNSIRLRVTQTELDQMRAGGDVKEVVDFGGGSQLAYRLSQAEGLAAPTATFSHAGIDIKLPRPTVVQWAGTDEISIKSEQDIGESASLAILVEKDFACLKPRAGEDDADMFANPDAG